GCGLRLDATGQLTGTLQDGSLINTPLSGAITLINAAWSGVLQPLNADGSSVFKAGSTIPVKFQLLDTGACPGNLTATLPHAKVSDGVAGPVNEADSTSAATTGNQFRYDGTSGQYVFNWSTKGLTSGTYELQINLGDGVIRTVRLGLK